MKLSTVFSRLRNSPRKLSRKRKSQSAVQNVYQAENLETRALLSADLQTRVLEVRDDTQSAESFRGDTIEVNGNVFFTANDGIHGRELWRTDGTEAGTFLLRDITYNGHSDPANLVDFNGTLFFTVNGTIWKSDGTTAGTTSVRYLTPYERLSDFNVSGDNLYFVFNEISVTNTDVEDHVVISGYDDEKESIRFQANGSDFILSVDGDFFRFESSNLQLTINGNGGGDTVSVTGNSGPDVATLSYQNLDLTGETYHVIVQNADVINVSGNGGADRVNIIDSAADDTLFVKANTAWMRSETAYIAAREFRTLVADSFQGYDVARFFDSPGDDTFVAKPTYATMQYPGFYKLARNFEYTDAVSAAGGRDSAQLYDSAEDDQFVTSAATSYLTSDNFTNVARGFTEVRAFANSGGNDTVQFVDATGTDRLQAKKTYAYLYSAAPRQYVTVAYGFENMAAWSVRGGSDILDLFSDLDYAFEYFGNWNVNNM